TLISDLSFRRLWRAELSMVAGLLVIFVDLDLALQYGGELFLEHFVARGDAFDPVGVSVVGPHRGNGGEQAHGGGDQRLGNVRRDHGDGDVLHFTQALERTHDAP